MRKKSTIELHRLSSSDYAATPKLPLRVVLDNVRSQHNIGSVFRTSDAYLVDEIELCGICCCPPNNELHKTALGAEETVRWRYWQDSLAAVQALHEEGYKVFAVEQAFGSIPLGDYAYDTPLAVVFGHEVFGVSQNVIDACDGCIELPQFGTKHSLNVSVTAGIVIYTIAQALLV